MLKFYVNPQSWDAAPLVKAFETEALRDEYAPAFAREVVAVPADFSHQKYDYDFDADAWLIKPEWVAQRAVDDAIYRREGQLHQAVEQVQHWDMMGEPEQAAAWRNYYRELYSLEQAPGWPLAPQWPTAPDLAA